MNGDFITTGLLFLVSGLPFLVCGYLIAVKGKTSLIAGWNEEEVADPRSYARVLGWTGILCGVFLGISAYVYSAGVISIFLFLGSLLIAAFVQVLAAAFCSRRYRKA